MNAFIKSSDDLSLSYRGILSFLISVIGGSKLTTGQSIAVLERSEPVAKSSRWSIMAFVLTATLVFGGAGGNWFGSEQFGESFLSRTLQLTAGSMAMAALVSTFGSLFFGRNPIRWGIGMPLAVYMGGVFMALVSGREGAMALVYGAPLFLGLIFAAGVMSAFLVDGICLRGQRN